MSIPVFPYRALVADDSADHRALVHDMLEPLGFDVAFASDGRELFWKLHALRRVPNQPDWIVLTDIRMPVYGGLDVLEAWPDEPFPCPVVVMTAFPDLAVAERVRSLGGLLLAKPFTLEQLRRTLARACEAADAHDAESAS